jgi:hypothetical protein
VYAGANADSFNEIIGFGFSCARNKDGLPWDSVVVLLWGPMASFDRRLTTEHLAVFLIQMQSRD